ncbi:MAG: YkvA family protein [Candidatus Rifleibacteriota bacterium]
MPTIEELKQKFEYYKELAMDEHAPDSAKIAMIIAILYLLSPIDLIPDFIPIIGFLDDLIIVPLLFSWAFRKIEAARALHQEQTRKEIGNGPNDHCETN